MPPKNTKPKHAPNQHDKRHENGLAPPGKRLTKQRSNGQLNAQLNGKPVASTVPPPQLPSTGLNQGIKFPRPADAPSHTATDPTTAAAATSTAIPELASTATVNNLGQDHATSLERSDRDRITLDGFWEEPGQVGASSTATGPHEPSGPPAAIAASFSTFSFRARSSTVTGGSSSFAMDTVLSFYPLRDAISILILLLSLPPPMVLAIQTLFASLTFVPPTAGFSLSNLPNVKDLFSSTNIAAPALWTIVLIDLVVGLVYMLVGNTLQGIMLDTAQVAIAVSLSGAAAGSSEPTYSITVCTLVVCVVHVLRYTAIHLLALDYLRSVINKADFISLVNTASKLANTHSSPPIQRGWFFTLIHTILGIHILSQGITTCIRRILVKANEKDQSPPAIARNDADTAVSTGSEHALRSTSSLADISATAHNLSASDSRHSSAALPRDARSRDANRKKRKMANQVRGQQPLWAAIASTKVTFVKEVEQREAVGDSREVSIMDSTTSTLPLANATPYTNRIWFSDVRDNGVTFCVDLSGMEPSGAASNETCLATGIDKTKPFLVQINGAAWGPTTIESLSTSDESARQPTRRYICNVFGLSPLTSYHCEVVSIVTQEVVCSARLITQPAPSAEQTASQVVQPLHPNLRPSSPITTLKQSIQSAEAKLNEVRNRTRKSKKDQRSAHSDMKKEINSLKSKVESSGGADDKQERRILQIKQHKSQAEEATADIKRQIEALGEIDGDEAAEHEANRRGWQSALALKDGAAERLDALKADQDRNRQVLENEIAAVESKKEKVLGRIAQRVQELERLAAKQLSEQSARQTRESERAQILEDRMKRESELRFHIANLESDAQNFTRKANEVWQQVNSLNWKSTSPLPQTGYSSPPTPEAGLTGKADGTNNSHANGFHSAFAPPPPYAASNANMSSAFIPSHVPFAGATTTAFANGAVRGRSSSMHSQMSGLTDDEDALAYSSGVAAAGIPHTSPHAWPAQINSAAFIDRKASIDESSGSGSGSGYGGNGSLTNGSTNGSNSPRPDAKVFVPGAVAAAAAAAASTGKSVGTIGPPGRKSAQSSPTVAHAGAAGAGGR